MKNISLASASILMLIGIVLLAGAQLAPAHGASTGVICIAPAGATSCPSVPPKMFGTLGTQERVAVFIQGSAGLDGFDVILLANHTVLKPTGVDLTGSVLIGSPVMVVQCLEGVLIRGSSCSPADTVDTIHLVATSALGSPLTTTPTTGLLFTAIYNVTSATSGIPLGFQTGCSNTSVSPNICVTVANGTPSPDPETVQAATFSTSTTPDFALGVSPGSITVNAGFSATASVSITSLNDFSGNVGLATTISPAGPSVTLSSTTVTPTPNQTVTSTLTITTSTSTLGGIYSVVVTGTSGTLSHSVTASITVIPLPQPDFSITTNPTSIIIISGSSGAFNITLTSLNGFIGTVNLAASISPAGPSLSISPLSVTLSKGGTGSSRLLISTISSTSLGSYTATISGTSGTISHSVTVPITVEAFPGPDFTITANSQSLTISAGSSGTSTISVKGINGFNSTVFLTVSASAGLTATISPTSTGPFGTATLTVSSTAAGSYSAQVTGTSGSLSHATTVTVAVSSSGVGVVCIIPSGTTSCPSGPATVTGTSGTQVRVSVFIQGSGGLLGFDVTLLVDHTILEPVAIDLTGSVLIGTPVIVLECRAGVLLIGPTCSATDSVNTIHLAATSAVGSPLTSSPTTGLLFTAIYNVTGTTSGIPLAFQNGCANTSVSPSICVTIANGIPTPVPETIQTATFSNGGPVPDFTITASPTSLTVARGSCDATSTVTLTSIGSFSGTITLTTTSAAGITATLSGSAVTLSPGGTATIALTVCIAALTPSGSYTITVTATSGSITHTATITLIIPSEDFHASASPNVLTIRRGSTNSSTGVSTLTVASLGGFSGTISILTSITPKAPHGPTVTLSSTSLTLSSGGTAQVFLTVAASKNTSVGTYTVAVTFTSGSITQTVVINVTVVR